MYTYASDERAPTPSGRSRPERRDSSGLRRVEEACEGASASRESGASSLETTALVHEAFLKLASGRHPSYENRAHFYGIASRLMRQVLVDTARSRAAEKRGPGREVALADVPDWSVKSSQSLLALDEALQRLEKADPLKGQLIEMRFFGGMTAEEASAAVSKPVHTVRRELRLAQAWLRQEMAGETMVFR